MISLYAHQKAGVADLVRLRRAILAWEMGTGKTITSLVAATKMGLRPVVVAPSSLVPNWHREAHKCGVTDAKIFSDAKLPESVHGPYALICDEAHRFGNARAQRTDKVLRLSAGAAAVMLLTGTPMRNGQPKALFPLLRAVGHPLGKSKQAFETRYCGAKLKELWIKRNGRPTKIKIWDNTGASNLDELRERTSDVLLRKTKEECLDLPTKTVVTHSVLPSLPSQAYYESVVDECRSRYTARLEAGLAKEGGEHMVELSAIRQAASRAKVDEAVQLVEDVLDQGGQVVVFTEFQETAKAIAKAFAVRPYIGSTAPVVRDEIVEHFQAGSARVFVGTIAAGGLGLTLTAANHVIMVDRPMTPGDNVQAQDRCHRIGQRWPVTVTEISMFPIDEKLDAMLAAKADNQSVVIDGKRLLEEAIYG